MIMWVDLEGNKLEKTITVWFHFNVESKKQNKWTNKTKQQQTHRYKEQTGGCQRGGVLGDGQNR